MMSALLVRSAWMVAPPTVTGELDGDDDWNGLVAALGTAPVAAAAGPPESGVVGETGATDAGAAGVVVSPLITARSVCAMRLASAFFRYRMWTLPVLEIGLSSCSMRLLARTMRTGLSERSRMLFVR